MLHRLYAQLMLRQPLATELEAATIVAAKAELAVVTPEVLHLGNHTSARLTPLPVVARIASGTTFDFSEEGIARELTIALHLAGRQAPAVRPTTTVAPGPYLENHCAITLWEFVNGRRVMTQADERLAAVALRQLHSDLAGFASPLPSFMNKVDSCELILSDPDQAPMLAPDNRLFLRRVYERLRTELDGIGGKWQPLHGDAHTANALITDGGATWMDLESVCVGPIEWDVGFLPTATWREFSGIDLGLIELLAAVRALCVATWCWAEFDRSAATNDAATHHLSELKKRFR